MNPLAMIRRSLVRPRRASKATIWLNNGTKPPAPHKVKTAVLARHGIPGATWVETGTLEGTTTSFLATDVTIAAKRVISLEPSELYFRKSSARLASLANVTLINTTSEKGLEDVVSQLSGPTCFWLDGHYSQGATLAGEMDTPILFELSCIEASMERIRPSRVFVDDVRLFAHMHRETDDPSRAGYPPLRALVDWAERNRLGWVIEHDIFIAWAD